MRDADGWAPIADYGLLSNGRTVAMVALDGRVDWWPLPALDSDPVFAAILDPDNGGYLELQPVDDYTVTRRYIGDSNVLETTFHTASGIARVTDALTMGRGGSPLAWGELVRRIDGVEGAVSMRWAIRAGTRFGTTKPSTQHHGDTVVVHCGDQHLALRCFDVGAPTATKRGVVGSFTTSPSSTGILAISASDNAPIYLPDRRALESRLDDTLHAWHDWCAQLTYEGPWSAAVRRSGLVLKLLRYSPTGAIAAAATTSLPERIGGAKNWDYRFTWVRDTAFTVDSCIQLGLDDEVHAAVTWLLKSVRSTLPGLNVFYRLDGTSQQRERDIGVAGYRNSRPVRVGNRAASQTQLGTYGDLFDCVSRYVHAGHLLDAQSAEMLTELADRCCNTWRSKDAGIWELTDKQHYTASKIGCWVALDRAVQLHESGHLRGRHVRRWKRERDAIKAWVNEHCWSADKQSYTFFAGSDRLDAAVLLGGLCGFELGERFATTVDAIRRELAVGPLIYRYTGMDAEEGAFLACSFWMVSALAALDRLDDATALMDEATGLCNDLGLMAEQMDPATREMLGNVPQGLSHLALVSAAFAVARADQRRETKSAGTNERHGQDLRVP